jgi:hypothetical protein
MSSVSFASVLRFGALSADGPPEPFVEFSTDAEPVLVALLRLRRRRAERLVPLPVPAVVVPAPFVLTAVESVSAAVELSGAPPSGRLRPAPPDEDR